MDNSDLNILDSMFNLTETDIQKPEMGISEDTTPTDKSIFSDGNVNRELRLNKHRRPNNSIDFSLSKLSELSNF